MHAFESESADPPSPGAVMSRYAVPLGFTLAALWVAIIFVLVSGPSH